jgi:hypothetical protein
MNVAADEATQFIGDLLEKFGTDTDKWREHLNNLPKDQREMTFTFDTDGVKNGFVLKLNYIYTAVEIIIKDEKVLKEIKEGNME